MSRPKRNWKTSRNIINQANNIDIEPPMYLPGVRFKVTPTDHDPIKTGADSGIGRATARLFAAEGAQLTLLDRDAEAVAQFALELGAFDVALDSLLTLSFLGSLSRTIC